MSLNFTNFRIYSRVPNGTNTVYVTVLADCKENGETAYFRSTAHNSLDPHYEKHLFRCAEESFAKLELLAA